MKKRFLFAALGLAAALFVFGEGSAKADHYRTTGYGAGYSGYGAGYGGYGNYPGGLGVAPGYPGAAGYDFDRGYRGGFDRGSNRCRPPVPPCRHQGYYGGYGNNVNVLTPGLQLGIRY